VIWLPGRRGCAGHRAALVEFAAHRAGGPDVRRALDHVDRCRACEAELAATTLVLHALRRLHEDTRRAEPAADGWARLRARLATTRREPSRLLSGLPGIIAAAGLCAALVGPAAIGNAGPAGIYNEAPRGTVPPYLEFERSRERARAAGLLPVVEERLPYTGVRIAPPPITADLPLSMRREVGWIDDIVDEAAPVAALPADGVAQRQADRR
jgi:hypothetical protein